MLAFRISIQKIFKLLLIFKSQIIVELVLFLDFEFRKSVCTSIFKLFRNYWHRVTDIENFEKRVKNSLGHTLNFCPNLMECRFKNVSNIITYPVISCDLVYKLSTFCSVKAPANFISSGSKIVKHFRRRQYDPAIIERTIIDLVFVLSIALNRPLLKRCTLTKKAMG